MSPPLVIMLVWIGVPGNVSSGTAAVVPGFGSMAACIKAKPTVLQFYNGYVYRATAECVTLDRE